MYNSRPLFFTFHSVSGAEQNPHSVAVLEALKKFGCDSVVLYFSTEIELLSERSMKIGLFDSDLGKNRVNHWSVVARFKHPLSSIWLPPWWRMGVAVVAITGRCVSLPSRISRAALQIRHSVAGYTEYHPNTPPSNASV